MNTGIWVGGSRYRLQIEQLCNNNEFSRLSPVECGNIGRAIDEDRETSVISGARCEALTVDVAQ